MSALLHFTSSMSIYIWYIDLVDKLIYDMPANLTLIKFSFDSIQECQKRALVLMLKTYNFKKEVCFEPFSLQNVNSAYF